MLILINAHLLGLLLYSAMPERSKRKQQLEMAREAKQQQRSEDSQGEAQDSTLHSSAVLEDLDASSVLVAIDTSALFEDINESMSDDEEEYDPEVQQYDENFSIESHAKEWAEMLGT